MSLEFPHWTETGNLAEAARVVRAVEPDQRRHPRRHAALRPLGLEPRRARRRCRANGSASRTSATPRRKCPPTMAGIIRTARDERQFPGEGGIDVRGILARMPQDIPYALEIPRVALTKAVGPEEVARLALAGRAEPPRRHRRSCRPAGYRAAPPERGMTCTMNSHPGGPVALRRSESANGRST